MTSIIRGLYASARFAELEYNKALEKIEFYSNWLAKSKKSKDKISIQRAKAGLSLWTVYEKQLEAYDSKDDIPF